MVRKTLCTLLLALCTAAHADGWQTVGTPGISVGPAWYTVLAFGPDGKPYVAYSDEGNASKATVMRLDAAGTGWEAVGGAGFSAGAINNISLAFGTDGRPYVAYEVSYHISVMRLDTAGTGWESGMKVAAPAAVPTAWPAGSTS